MRRENSCFIASDSSLAAVARDFGGDRYETYAFEGGPYLGFPKSHDLYGDGAIVVVPAPGHTPGSVIVFVATPQGDRFAFVGDLCWQGEGVTEREERPWLQRVFADDDGRPPPPISGWVGTMVTWVSSCAATMFMLGKPFW